MLSRRPTRLLAAALAVGASASCAAVFGFETLEDQTADAATPDAPALDAASEDAEADAGARCPQLTLPPKPKSPDSSRSLDNLTFAMDRLDVRPANALNLDGLCTREASESSCLVDPESEGWLDGEDGADLGGNGMLEKAASFFPAAGPENILASLAYGYANTLVRVTGWNGEADDPNVAVTVFASPGLKSTTDAGGIERRIPDPSNPTEVWSWTERTTIFGYVSGFRLVAEFKEPLPLLIAMQVLPDGALPPAGTAIDANGAIVGKADGGVVGRPDERPLTIKLGSALLLATLVPPSEGKPFRLEDGTIAGRVAIEPFRAEFAQIRNAKNNDAPLCQGGASTLALATGQVCGARDIRADKRVDVTLPCDALAVSFGFAGHLARVNIGEEPLPIDPCPGFTQEACPSP